jgi:hypothetical protein
VFGLLSYNPYSDTYSFDEAIAMLNGLDSIGDAVKELRHIAWDGLKSLVANLGLFGFFALLTVASLGFCIRRYQEVKR